MMNLNSFSAWFLLNLHIHDVGISLHHAVAHMQRRLKADLRLLDGDHGFFQAYLGVFQLHFFLQASGVVLRRADRAQRAFQGTGKPFSLSACDLARSPPGGQLGSQGDRHGVGGKSEVHEFNTSNRLGKT